MASGSVSLHRPLHTSRPHVVIVGGGFGGLYTARGLARTPVAVTVVDQHNYHLFRPMLYQVATGLLSADEIAAPIRSVLRKQKNTEVLMAKVIGVDTQHHLGQTPESDFPYDYLILATGSHYNYFGHDEWMTVAPGLHSVDDADLIRGKILRAFEDAERLAANGQADPETLQALLTFILVGGGTAGVEMAGTIAEMARMALAHDFRHIDPRSAHIVLFEAAPRILPGYPEQLSARAHHHLEQLGVRVRTSTKVEDVDASGVVVAGQRIGSHTVLWTAGVVASPAGQWLGVETDRAGRVKVQPDLSVPGDPNIFAIGDTASVVASTRNLFGIRRKEPVPLPGVAQPAIQAGKYVASVIRRRVLGLPVPAPFCYWDKGSLAIVGRTFAVADVPPFRFWGVLAWLLWLDLLYLSPSFIWWQAVAGILGATLSNALCNNSRCTWRYRKGARNVYNTAIRRVLSPLRLCGSVTADVHGCPRGVAPIGRPLAIRDTPVAHTGGATTPSPYHATGCDAHPSVLLSPPGHGFSTLDVR